MKDKLWLCVTTYSDPKHTTIKRVTGYRQNAYRSIDFYDRDTHKTYVAESRCIYELDFESMKITEENNESKRLDGNT